MGRGREREREGRVVILGHGILGDRVGVSNGMSQIGEYTTGYRGASIPEPHYWLAL